MLRQQTLADCIDAELILNKSSMPRREKGPRHFLESGFQLAVNDWVVPEWHYLIFTVFFLASPTYWNVHTNPATASRISKGCVNPRIVSFTQIIGHCCVKERAAPQAVITNLSMHLVRSEVVGNLDSLFWEAL